MATVPWWVWHLALAVGAIISAVVLLGSARPRGRWGARLRSRLVVGLPLGTMLATAFVLAVYLGVQNGLGHWQDPTTIPYRAWSYTYPLGMIVAPFAHAGPAHLLGNLVGTLTFGVLAEYAWGHVPRDRGRIAFSSLGTNPYARAFAFFVGAVGVGILTSLFSLGPVIGFSGVVFAFVGLALVRYPLATVVVLVGSDAVRLFLDILRSPTTTASAGTEFVTPWFAGIAIHGHYLGLLLGVVIGVVLVQRRRVAPPPARLWFAALVVGVDQALWAIYIPLDGPRYLLLRAVGGVLLLLLAALVTASARSSARTLVSTIDLSRREASVGLLVAVVLAMAIVVVPFNLLAVDDPAAGADEPLRVGDYLIYYTEDVPHQFVPPIEGPLGSDGRVNASGVIVSSQRRGIWWPEVTADELAAQDTHAIHLGGPGWRRTVRATRPAWRTVGGQTAYKVYLQTEDRDPQLAYTSDAATVDAVIAGRNLSIVPTIEGFDLVVTRADQELGRTGIPANGSRVAIGGLQVARQGSTLLVTRNGTRLRIASRSGSG